MTENVGGQSLKLRSEFLCECFRNNQPCQKDDTGENCGAAKAGDSPQQRLICGVTYEEINCKIIADYVDKRAICV